MIHSFAQFSLNMLLAINQYKTSIQCSAWQIHIQKRLISSQHAVAGQYLLWPDSTWMSIYLQACSKQRLNTQLKLHLSLFSISRSSKRCFAPMFPPNSNHPPFLPKKPTFPGVTCDLFVEVWRMVIKCSWPKVGNKTLHCSTLAFWVETEVLMFGELENGCWGEVVWWRKFRDIHAHIYIYISI